MLCRRCKHSNMKHKWFYSTSTWNGLEQGQFWGYIVCKLSKKKCSRNGKGGIINKCSRFDEY